MDSRSIILAALLFALFLSLPGAINGVGVQILIDNACLRSTTPKTCIATLQQVVGQSLVPDAIYLAQMAIRAVSDQSTTAVVFLGLLGQKHPSSTKTFTQCSDFFQNTKGVLIVGDGDFKTGVAISHIESASGMVSSCDTALKNDKIMIPGLDDVINKWNTLYDAAHCATIAATFDI